MERLAQRLADRLTSTRFELEAVVTALSRRRDGRYTVRFRRGRTAIEEDFDAVVLAVPYNQLQAIEMTGERLRRAMAAHIAHYDSPGHYLRVSVLFDRPFWRRLFTGSWIMLDAFGGCCVYDESAGRDKDGYGVLGWLLAGADALRLSNADDRTLAGLRPRLSARCAVRRGALMRGRSKSAQMGRRRERTARRIPRSAPARGTSARASRASGPRGRRRLSLRFDVEWRASIGQHRHRTDPRSDVDRTSRARRGRACMNYRPDSRSFCP